MRLLTLSLAVLLTTSVRGQKFSHEIGASLALVVWEEKTEIPEGFYPDEDIKENASVLYPMLTYSPRYSFLQMKKSSVSISAPVSIGGGLARNYATDDLGFAFTYDLPLVVDYNFGSGSLPETESGVGGYLGGGFSYQYFSISGSIASDLKKSTSGPLIRGGVRFSNMSLGLYFRPGSEEPAYTTFGLNFLAGL